MGGVGCRDPKGLGEDGGDSGGLVEIQGERDGDYGCGYGCYGTGFGHCDQGGNGWGEVAGIGG